MTDQPITKPVAMRRNRLHFGMLNDNKVENLLKLGLLYGPKKTLSSSLQMAGVKSSLLSLLARLKYSFSPIVRLFRAYFFGLPSRPLQFLYHRLHKLNFLDTFIVEIVIITPNDFTKNGLALLGRSIHKFRRLRVLRVELEGKTVQSYNLQKEALDTFAYALGRLNMLKHVVISFNLMSVDRSGLAKVFRSLSKLNKIRYLEVDIGDIECQDDKGLFELGESLRFLKQMVMFSLNLDVSPNIGAENLINFLKKLSNVSSLKAIDLSLLNCGINADIIQALVEMFEKLDRLESVKLLMFSALISPGDYRKLWEALGKLKKLETLEIRAGAVNNQQAMEKVGFGELGVNVGGLKELKNLNITLRGSEDIDDNDIMKLGDEICKAESLEDIEVHLMQFGKVTYEGMMKLKEKLKDMPKDPKLTIKT